MQTKLKATPGPWLVTTTPTGKGKVTDSSGFSICNTTAGSNKQQMRDAKLIAAAPDLYAACEAFLRYQDMVNSGATNGLIKAYADMYEAAQSALAKARGE